MFLPLCFNLVFARTNGLACLLESQAASWTQRAGHDDADDHGPKENREGRLKLDNTNNKFDEMRQPSRKAPVSSRLRAESSRLNLRAAPRRGRCFATSETKSETEPEPETGKKCN